MGVIGQKRPSTRGFAAPRRLWRSLLIDGIFNGRIEVFGSFGQHVSIGLMHGIRLALTVSGCHTRRVLRDKYIANL